MRTLLLTLAALFISIVTMISCTKEKNVNINKNVDNGLIARVNMFNQNLAMFQEGKILKSEVSKTIPETRQTYDEVFNYTYSYSGIACKKLFTFNSRIEIPITDEQKVTPENVYTYYNIVLDTLRTKYRAIDAPEKKLLTVMITDKGQNANGTAQLLSLTAIVGSQLLEFPNIFGPEDDWNWRYDSQNCAETIFLKGAGMLLEQNINWYYKPLSPAPGYHLVFTQNEPITITITDGDNTFRITNDVLDNYKDYRLFFAKDNFDQTPGNPFHITPEVECVEDAEMNFYFQQNGQLMLDIRDGLYPAYYANPNNKQFNLCSFDPEEYLTYPQNWRIIRHNVTYTYGILHIVPNGYPTISLD